MENRDRWWMRCFILKSEDLVCGVDVDGVVVVVHFLNDLFLLWMKSTSAASLALTGSVYISFLVPGVWREKSAFSLRCLCLVM